MFTKTKILVGGIVLAAIVMGWSATALGGKIGRPLSALGISKFECQCSQKISGDRQTWVFHSEPRVNRVDRDGPAYGKLKDGDYIVAIDGKLITTRSGGRHFGNIEAGDEVVLTVRRGDRTFDETITAWAGDDDAVNIVIDDLDYDGDTPLDLSESIEALSRLTMNLDDHIEIEALLDLGDLIESLEDLSDAADLSLEEATINLGNLRDIRPRGWFGFGFSFSGTVRTQDGEPRWEFESLPEVRSVDPDSPAERAGIRKGDVLTHIDGTRLTSRRGGERFSETVPGQAVEWTYKRGRESHTVEMTAVERPERYDHRYKVRTRGSSRDSVRFTGELLGRTRIQVRGKDSTRIRVTEEDGKIVIKTRDGVIEIEKTDDDDEDED